MRALLLIFLVVALAGCTDERQWAGIAEARMYVDSALVEMQLHRGVPGQGATEQTAEAGMGRVVSIENAVATFTLRNGRNVTMPIDNWVFDRENQTVAAPVNLTRFDGFTINATFVMKDGTRLPTGELASWTETYRRPYYSTLRLNPRSTETGFTLTVYAVNEGAREYAVPSIIDNGTLTQVAVKQIAAWALDLDADGGTRVDRTMPTANVSARVTLPVTGVTRAEPTYTFVLDEGVVISDRDVDNDAYPEALFLQKRLRQEN